MDVLDAIYARQSVGKVKPDPVARSEIEKLLGAAVQAPNHYRVAPWRFAVLTGKARDKLGEALAAAFRRKFPHADGEALDKERAKPLRAPLIIVVVAEPALDPRVLEIENICAAAAACQNVLLAATGLGLAAHWRTGNAAREPEVTEFLGLAREQKVIAFLYIGHPQSAVERHQRPSFEDRTTWMD